MCGEVHGIIGVEVFGVERFIISTLLLFFVVEVCVIFELVVCHLFVYVIVWI